MFIKSEHNGEERRKNGGKIRISLSLMDWLKIGTTVCLLMAGGFGFYYNTTWGMQAIAEETEKNGTKVKELTKENKRQDESLIQIKSDISYIKEDVQEMKATQNETKILVQRILWKLEEK